MSNGGTRGDINAVEMKSVLNEVCDGRITIKNVNTIATDIQDKQGRISYAKFNEWWTAFVDYSKKHPITKPEVKVESKPEVKIEPKPKPKPEPIPKVKIEPKPEPIPETKPEVKVESKPEAKIDPKPKPKPEPIPEPIPEVKIEPKPEPIPEPIPEVKIESIPEPKSEPSPVPSPQAHHQRESKPIICPPSPSQFSLGSPIKEPEKSDLLPERLSYSGSAHSDWNTRWQALCDMVSKIEPMIEETSSFCADLHNEITSSEELILKHFLCPEVLRASINDSLEDHDGCYFSRDHSLFIIPKQVIIFHSSIYS